jgi:hypothetical protein
MPSIAIKGATVAHLPAAKPPEVSPNRYAPVPTGICRLIPVADGFTAVEAIVDGVCIPTGSGYGGWTVAPRDGQTGVVEYTGTEPVRYTLPLLLDGWIEKVSVQDPFNALLNMAGGTNTPRPTAVYVIGSVPPAVDYTVRQRKWLIESITPTAEKTLYAPDSLGASRLMRQGLTIVLLQPEDPTFTVTPVKKAQSKKAGGTSKAPRYVVARSGDTLLTIAARNRKKWHDLAKLNGIRDPASVHRGQRIRIS